MLLFHFYVFWCAFKLGDFGDEDGKLSEIYRDEADVLLEECGYEPLYAGNPFDWVFLFSAGHENPLETFRNILLTLYQVEI